MRCLPVCFLLLESLGIMWYDMCDRRRGGFLLLYYIRHGDPVYEPDSLTALGRRQAEAVGKRLAMHGIDRIYSSTSNRAYQTALPLSELTKKDIEQMDFLNEGHAWKYFAVSKDGGPTSWLYHQPHFRALLAKDEFFALGHKWYEHPELQQYPFKEGTAFFDTNIDELLLSLGYRHDRKRHCYEALRENEERVAVFAHEGVGSVFLSSVLDIPYSLFAAHYAMSHTGVSVIRFDGAGNTVIPQLLHFSNDSHLYKEGLPTKYWNQIFT